MISSVQVVNTKPFDLCIIWMFYPFF
uniref:Uncharacterized protein n=1 Tax=Arundo donax TaxID=35708 RepID=A0A0A8YWZ9_ARUDO